jgi:hypothetical protein
MPHLCHDRRHQCLGPVALGSTRPRTLCTARTTRSWTAAVTAAIRTTTATRARTLSACARITSRTCCCAVPRLGWPPCCPPSASSEWRKRCGILPIARLVPQDVHSVLDYLGSAMIRGGALLTDDVGARAASLGLMTLGLVVSALTDYRISLAKIIPVVTSPRCSPSLDGICIRRTRSESTTSRPVVRQTSVTVRLR